MLSLTHDVHIVVVGIHSKHCSVHLWYWDESSIRAITKWECHTNKTKTNNVALTCTHCTFHVLFIVLWSCVCNGDHRARRTWWLYKDGPTQTDWSCIIHTASESHSSFRIGAYAHLLHACNGSQTEAAQTSILCSVITALSWLFALLPATFYLMLTLCGTSTINVADINMQYALG